MIPMRDPSVQDPNNEPWTRRDTIKYLFFALALPIILAIAPFIFFGRHKAPPKQSANQHVDTVVVCGDRAYRCSHWPPVPGDTISVTMVDSEATQNDGRLRWHDGHIFAGKPNPTWPWLIFDSSVYKASKWFGKMDTPHRAQWIQKGELIPIDAVIQKTK